MWQFDIHRSSDGYFYFKLVAPNGVEVLISEPFRNKSACEAGLVSVKSLLHDTAHYTLQTANGDLFYFCIHSRDGNTLARSIMFEKEYLRNACIELVSFRGLSAIPCNN